MNHLLTLHTTDETAIVSICEGEKVMASRLNDHARGHASFVHTAIRDLLHECGIPVASLSAVSVTGGPGSYTGIRVGLASAKGLCYALKIPLIMLNTLEVMAYAAVKQAGDPAGLYIPLIDARRMEAFTAVYNYHLHTLLPPSAVILNENLFRDFKGAPFYFFGSGSSKLKEIYEPADAFFLQTGVTPEALGTLSWHKYQLQNFSNLFEADPIYVKDFYTNGKK